MGNNYSESDRRTFTSEVKKDRGDIMARHNFNSLFVSVSVISSLVKIPTDPFSSHSAHSILMSSDLLLRWRLPVSGRSLRPLAITLALISGRAEKQSHTAWNLNCLLFLKALPPPPPR